jgi:hypothetical protein
MALTSRRQLADFDCLGAVTRNPPRHLDFLPQGRSLIFGTLGQISVAGNTQNLNADIAIISSSCRENLQLLLARPL